MRLKTPSSRNRNGGKYSGVEAAERLKSNPQRIKTMTRGMVYY